MHTVGRHHRVGARASAIGKREFDAACARVQADQFPAQMDDILRHQRSERVVQVAAVHA